MKKLTAMTTTMMSIAVSIAVSVAVPATAFAHGAKPEHGGVVQTANDMQFELVRKGGTATIYVADHGKPVSTAGFTGKLTVLNGTVKTELPLTPSGANQLSTTGEAKLAAGAKVVASITFADKKAMSVRFAVR